MINVICYKNEMKFIPSEEHLQFYEPVLLNWPENIRNTSYYLKNEFEKISLIHFPSLEQNENKIHRKYFNDLYFKYTLHLICISDILEYDIPIDSIEKNVYIF
jgi:hypothetical protein